MLMLTFKEGFRSWINEVSLIFQCKLEFPEPKISTVGNEKSGEKHTNLQ